MGAVRVADNGPGIPDGAFGSRFEPFFTTRADGNGPGLALCRTIIEGHGGRIWAERPEEGGAAFLFTLPRA